MNLNINPQFIEAEGVKRNFEDPFSFSLSFDTQIPKWAKLLFVERTLYETKVVFEIPPRSFNIVYKDRYNIKKDYNVSLPWQYMYFIVSKANIQAKLLSTNTKVIDFKTHKFTEAPLLPNLDVYGGICLGDILYNIPPETKKDIIKYASIFLDRFFNSVFTTGMGNFSVSGGRLLEPTLLSSKTPEEICTIIEPRCTLGYDSFFPTTTANRVEWELKTWLSTLPIYKEVVSGTTKLTKQAK